MVRTGVGDFPRVQGIERDGDDECDEKEAAGDDRPADMVR